MPGDPSPGELRQQRVGEPAGRAQAVCSCHADGSLNRAIRQSAEPSRGSLQREAAQRETGVFRASTTGAHGIDFSYRLGAAA